MHSGSLRISGFTTVCFNQSPHIIYITLGQQSHTPSRPKFSQSTTDLIDSLSSLPLYQFSTSSDVCQQVINYFGYNAGIIFGQVNSSSDTGLPTASNYFILGLKWGGNTYADIFAIRLATVSGLYRKVLNNGTWGSWYQYTGTTISTSSVGDQVVMGEDD